MLKSGLQSSWINSSSLHGAAAPARGGARRAEPDRPHLNQLQAGGSCVGVEFVSFAVCRSRFKSSGPALGGGVFVLPDGLQIAAGLKTKDVISNHSVQVTDEVHLFW